MIRTKEEIELIVMQCKGTWVKRRNLRKKLTEESNSLIYREMDILRGKIRDLRAMGAKEEVLRYWYSEVTKLEVQIL
jgi:hypothetical protein